MAGLATANDILYNLYKHRTKANPDKYIPDPSKHKLKKGDFKHRKKRRKVSGKTVKFRTKAIKPAKPDPSPQTTTIQSPKVKSSSKSKAPRHKTANSYHRTPKPKQKSRARGGGRARQRYWERRLERAPASLFRGETRRTTPPPGRRAGEAGSYKPTTPPPPSSQPANLLNLEHMAEEAGLEVAAMAAMSRASHPPAPSPSSPASPRALPPPATRPAPPQSPEEAGRAAARLPTAGRLIANRPRKLSFVPLSVQRRSGCTH